MSVAQEIEVLAKHLDAWVSKWHLFPDGASPHARHSIATVISTFASLCAPLKPSRDGIWLAAKNLSVFFYLDDLGGAALREATAELDRVLAGDAYSTLPAVGFSQYLEHLEEFGDTQGYRRQLSGFFDLLLEEDELVAGGKVSVADCERLRPQLVYLKEFLWTWVLTEEIPVNVFRESDEVCETAMELVFLVNDIGSVARESAGGVCELNLVLSVATELQLSQQDALDRVIARYNEGVERYVEQRGQMLLMGEEFTAMMELLDGVVEGNLQTTIKTSAVRYPGSGGDLARLQRLPLLNSTHGSRY